MKRILITAYDVDPNKGSESGMGWNFIVQIAKRNRVLAVTRKNNLQVILNYMRDRGIECDNLAFVAFDLPYYLRFWKRGRRGSSLYFYLWQLCMPIFLAKRRFNFDIAHNLNFHADWAPSMLWVFGKPMVWGPIGHHDRIPRDFVLGPYGRAGYLRDRLKWIFKVVFWRLDPFLWLTRRMARVILCMNRAVLKVPGIGPEKTVIFPSVGTSQPEGRSRSTGPGFQVLSVGRFVPLKGFDLTVRAFAAAKRRADALSMADPFTLVLVGRGEVKPMLEKLCAKLGITPWVTFIDWIEKDKLAGIYTQADVFLFPSHEGAGMVVAEALSFGLPVVCLANSGPGEFIDDSCGLKTVCSGYDRTVEALAESLDILRRDRSLRQELSEGALRKSADWFDWDAKGRFLDKIYAERC